MKHINYFVTTLWLTLFSGPVFADCVIFLHGLARTAGSLSTMAEAFETRGFVTANIDYPSRRQPIEQLASNAIERGVALCAVHSPEKIHFVTHSMGGILVRYYLSQTSLANIGAVVMLAPPNQGSEVVDNFKSVPGFKWLNGPAGIQLGTDKNSLPAKLGPVDFPVGIIAGNRTFNPILSLFLPNPDDGKVSVERTKVEGMSDFVVIPVSHPFIMNDEEAISQAVNFIEHGRFIR
jgi:triacylglycerol lipase